MHLTSVLILQTFYILFKHSSFAHKETHFS